VGRSGRGGGGWDGGAAQGRSGLHTPLRTLARLHHPTPPPPPGRPAAHRHAGLCRVVERPQEAVKHVAGRADVALPAARRQRRARAGHRARRGRARRRHRALDLVERRLAAGHVVGAAGQGKVLEGEGEAHRVEAQQLHAVDLGWRGCWRGCRFCWGWVGQGLGRGGLGAAARAGAGGRLRVTGAPSCCARTGAGAPLLAPTHLRPVVLGEARVTRPQAVDESLTIIKPEVVDAVKLEGAAGVAQQLVAADAQRAWWEEVRGARGAWAAPQGRRSAGLPGAADDAPAAAARCGRTTEAISTPAAAAAAAGAAARAAARRCGARYAPR
jgi:hypothetical protein